MWNESSLLQQIRERPHDDEPRLIYADLMDERGDPRGEFIRVQCELAGDDSPPENIRRRQLKQREAEMLEKYAPIWCGEIVWRRVMAEKPSLWSEPGAGGERFWRFHRGFIDAVSLPAAALLRHGEPLMRQMPVRTLRVTNAASYVGELAEFAPLAQARHLDLSGERLSAAAISQLAVSPLLASLKRLKLARCRLGDAGVRALAETAAFTSLSRLDLASNNLTDKSARNLEEAAWLGPLETLDIAANRLTGDGVLALLAAPRLSRLRRLRVTGNDVSLLQRGYIQWRHGDVAEF